MFTVLFFFYGFGPINATLPFQYNGFHIISAKLVDVKKYKVCYILSVDQNEALEYFEY